MTVKTLSINGQMVTASEDQTILDIALENNIVIPTLCHLEGLSQVGACRLCLVEITGSSKLQPACVTLADEGMEIRTDTERLKEYRRMIIELLFAERNHVCSICVVNGHCDLQDLAYSVGMDHVRFAYQNPLLEIDASHARFALDNNRCVLCTRCVRVCDEIEGAHTWDVMGRGAKARVITDLNRPWGESDTCTGCGKCIHVCPTGALSEKGKSTAEMIKKRDFLTYIKMGREKKLWFK
ncbi:MAG TPA: bidirectional hydrogenase complex protein HoxU [Terriglobia bacterium]|nr:bidirectional hydrogenase complex protein HoxU [Terriglobia bacterium]